MKYFFLALLLPLQLMAQKPVRHYDFTARKQTSMYAGELSVSPKQNLLLATFNDLDKRSVYELVNITTGKLIASGALPARARTISWTDDESLVTISFSRYSPVCYQVKAGMKPLFTAKMEGDAVFSRNSQLLAPGFQPDLYVFGDESIHRYNNKGVFLDSVELEDYNAFDNFDLIWFDVLRNRLMMAKSFDPEICFFSIKNKSQDRVTGKLLAADVKNIMADKDGSSFLYYSDNELFVHNAADGSKVASSRFERITAACFAPDSKKVLVFDMRGVSLMDLQGKILQSIKLPGFCSFTSYTAFGLEVVVCNPDGFDVYGCKDYFFRKEEPVVTKPPVVTNPVKDPVTPHTKLTPVVKEKPWSQPYTIREFITPFNKDSFYLYSADRALRYFIRYEKGGAGLFSPLSFTYSQFFGFSKDAKYQLVNNYVVDMTDSTARLGSYSRASSLGNDNPLMIGGQNYLGQISSSPGNTLSWPMNIFNEQYTLTAKLIDHTYKGKKAKCLLVTRDDPKNKINETYYYQQGVGLIRIDSNGKIGFER